MDVKKYGMTVSVKGVTASGSSIVINTSIIQPPIIYKSFYIVYSME